MNQQMRQIDLARAVAVYPAHLCRIENNADYCSDMLAQRIAAALGCAVEDFTAPGPHPNITTWRAAA
ncbi:MAG: hypothetical protein ACRDNS_05170 [Trebonia sp.]